MVRRKNSVQPKFCPLCGDQTITTFVNTDAINLYQCSEVTLFLFRSAGGKWSVKKAETEEKLRDECIVSV